jgi:hypothetical protein
MSTPTLGHDKYTWGRPSTLERAKGFEPSTPTLARLCSTPELHPHPRRQWPLPAALLCQMGERKATDSASCGVAAWAQFHGSCGFEPAIGNEKNMPYGAKPVLDLLWLCKKYFSTHNSVSIPHSCRLQRARSRRVAAYLCGTGLTTPAQPAPSSALMLTAAAGAIAGDCGSLSRCFSDADGHGRTRCFTELRSSRSRR